jgi:hypothetical protein
VGNGTPHILREGLPQGLSLSPLLCTLVVEQFKPPLGTFMYVDDGMFIGNKEGFKAFFEFMNKCLYAGAVIAPEKSGVVKEETKFLGCIINFLERTIKFPTGRITSWDNDLSQLIRDVKVHTSQLYMPESKEVK